MIKQVLTVVVICGAIESVKTEKYLPILLWHSAGESCCGSEMKQYTDFIKSQLGNDVHIKSVALDSFAAVDTVKSLTIHPFDQIKRVCDMLQQDSRFANGYHGIGLSQGGLLIRGLAQTCPSPPMRNLITLGAPQQGVHRYPRCDKWFGVLCGTVQASINAVAYSWPVQQFMAPLTYWHDTDEQRYKQGSTFLAVINNEKTYNANYVINLSNLRRIVLVKYQNDNAIVPNESTWFGYYDKNGVQFPMEQTEIYKSDKLGLRGLRESGQMVLLVSPRDHLDLDPSWFAGNIVPYLKEI